MYSLNFDRHAAVRSDMQMMRTCCPLLVQGGCVGHSFGIVYAYWGHCWYAAVCHWIKGL